MKARKLILTQNEIIRLEKFLSQCVNKRKTDRATTILLNANGLTSNEIAKQINRPLSRVSQWLRNYESRGFSCLFDYKRSGRPYKVGRENKKTLINILEQGPNVCGYMANFWNVFLLREEIFQRYGVQYDFGHIRRLRCQYRPKGLNIFYRNRRVHVS